MLARARLSVGVRAFAADRQSDVADLILTIDAGYVQRETLQWFFRWWPRNPAAFDAVGSRILGPNPPLPARGMYGRCDSGTKPGYVSGDGAADRCPRRPVIRNHYAERNFLE